MTYQEFFDANNALKNELAEVQRTIISLENGCPTIHLQGNRFQNRGIGQRILPIIREVELELVSEIQANQSKLKKIEEIIDGKAK